jgi:hypothetical protein
MEWLGGKEGVRNGIRLRRLAGMVRGYIRARVRREEWGGGAYSHGIPGRLVYIYTCCVFCRVFSMTASILQSSVSYNHCILQNICTTLS